MSMCGVCGGRGARGAGVACAACGVYYDLDRESRLCVLSLVSHRGNVSPQGCPCARVRNLSGVRLERECVTNLTSKGV